MAIDVCDLQWGEARRDLSSDGRFGDDWAIVTEFAADRARGGDRPPPAPRRVTTPDLPAEARGGPSAGWYRDPDGTPRMRWWDGHVWTWQVTSGAGVEWAAPPAPPPVPSASLPGLGVALAGFAIAVGLGFGAQALLLATGHPGGGPARLALSELGLWAGLLGAVAVVSHRRGRGLIRSDFHLQGRPVDLAYGLAGSLAGRGMVIGAVAPFSAFLLHHHQSVDSRRFHSVTGSASGWLVLVLVTCVGAPLVEELFFRGLIQTRLVARWGVVPGIALTSLLFGAAHLIGWAGPISLLCAWGIAAAGLVLGTLRHLTGRLGTSMAAHALFNAQSVALLALASSIS